MNLRWRLADEDVLPQLVGPVPEGLGPSMSMLLANLVEASVTGRIVGCTLSRLVPARRYTDLRHDPVREAIDLLVDRGLLGLHLGSEAARKCSRLWITPELCSRLVALGECRLVYRPVMEEIVRKNAKGRILDYRDTNDRRSMRNRLRRLNALLARTTLSLSPGHQVPPWQQKVLQTNKSMYRVFNRSRWNLGGRFFGGGWQGLPSADRKHLLIDGQPTVELDYKNNHVRMLYHRAGVDPVGDIYEIPGRPGLRQLGKAIILVALNAPDRKQAIGAVRNEVRQDPQLSDRVKAVREQTGMTLPQLYDEFLARHEPIAQYFGSGIGLHCQFLDSQIMDKILTHFTDLGIPALSMHDSLIVQHQYEQELRAQMLSAWTEKFGFPIPIEKK